MYTIHIHKYIYISSRIEQILAMNVLGVRVLEHMFRSDVWCIVCMCCVCPCLQCSDCPNPCTRRDDIVYSLQKN